MSKPTILVADDEEGIRESLELILGDEFTLAFAHDGEETLARVRHERFDVLLLDLKMPKLDGMEVLKQLKGLPHGPAVLVLTAYQSIELAREATKLGAHNYLPKPFERDYVLQAVRSAVSAQQTTPAPTATKPNLQ